MLAVLALALAVALTGAQVSGAHFNDPNYSPGEAPKFDGLKEGQVNEKLRDIDKYVSDLNRDIDSAERSSNISSERANQIRGMVRDGLTKVKSNYESWRKGGSSGGGSNGGSGNGGGNGGGAEGGASGGGNGGGTPPGKGADPNGGDRGGDDDAGRGPDRSGDDDRPGGNRDEKPGVIPGPAGSDGAALGGAGALIAVAGIGADSAAGGSPAERALRELARRGANGNVGIDISDNESLRKALMTATTGIPLGFQALMMALLFCVAVLMVLVVRERRRAQHVERVSQLDYLTGLANREGFDRMLAIEWRRALRYGHTLGLVFIDLDDFKRFNDSNGHLAGDRLLREVAAVINSEARASDYTARLGGDEFVILCPETDAEGLEALTKRLEGSSVGLPVSLSIGFTHQVPTDTTSEDLVGRADAAMYQAKSERGSFPVPGRVSSRTKFMS